VAEELLGGFTVGGGWCAGPVEDRHVAVDVGSVDEVDAQFDRGCDEPVGVLRGGGDAEGGGAQADPGHLHTGSAEDGVLQQSFLVCGRDWLARVPRAVARAIPELAPVMNQTCV
jgi:hypothetical protein